MTQPEALRLADVLEMPSRGTFERHVAAELRRLHAAHEISLRTIDRKADAIQELLVQRDELIEINRELLAALTGLTSATRSAIAKAEA